MRIKELNDRINASLSNSSLIGTIRIKKNKLKQVSNVNLQLMLNEKKDKMQIEKALYKNDQSILLLLEQMESESEDSKNNYLNRSSFQLKKKQNIPKGSEYEDEIIDKRQKSEFKSFKIPLYEPVNNTNLNLSNHSLPFNSKKINSDYISYS